MGGWWPGLENVGLQREAAVVPAAHVQLHTDEASQLLNLLGLGRDHIDQSLSMYIVSGTSGAAEPPHYKIF